LEKKNTGIYLLNYTTRRLSSGNLFILEKPKENYVGQFLNKINPLATELNDYITVN
jgi:hypothetical protein